MPLLDRIRRLPPVLWLLALVIATTGCFSHYTVIKQSGPPSALTGVAAVTVQFDYANIAISDKRMSEQQWLETREKAEHQQTYLETKESVNTGFLEGLQKGLGSGAQISMGQAVPGAIQVTVSYIEWDEGVYAGVVAWPSKVTARVIFTRDGETLDEIEVKTHEDATLYTPAPQQRFHTCGKRLGQFTSEFFNKAAAGG